MTEVTKGASRVEIIKAKYDALEMGYDEALSRLEALGMWAHDADNYLLPPKRKAAR